MWTSRTLFSFGKDLIFIVRIPADGSQPIVTRDGVSQPLPQGMTLSDLGISVPPSVNNNVNGGFVQGGSFRNGMSLDYKKARRRGMLNGSRLNRFRLAFGMHGRGRMFENLLSLFGRRYKQLLRPSRYRENFGSKVNSQGSNGIGLNTYDTSIRNVSESLKSNPDRSSGNIIVTATPDIMDDRSTVSQKPAATSILAYPTFKSRMADLLGVEAARTLVKNISVIDIVTGETEKEQRLSQAANLGNRQFLESSNSRVDEVDETSVITSKTDERMVTMTSPYRKNKSSENKELVIRAVFRSKGTIVPGGSEPDSVSARDTLLITGPPVLNLSLNKTTGEFKSSLVRGLLLHGVSHSSTPVHSYAPSLSLPVDGKSISRLCHSFEYACTSSQLYTLI